MFYNIRLLENTFLSLLNRYWLDFRMNHSFKKIMQAQALFPLNIDAKDESTLEIVFCGQTQR